MLLSKRCGTPVEINWSIRAQKNVRIDLTPLLRRRASCSLTVYQEADLPALSTEQLEAPRRHDDDEVMTIGQWRERNTLSRATAQRMFARGEGPDRIWLSPNRYGITYGADRAWKAKHRILPAT
jgi:hypothetical protein